LGVYELGIGPWRLDVGGILTAPLRHALRSGLASAAGSIPCEPVRAEVVKVWRPYVLPVDLPDGGKAYVLVKPRSLGTTGLIPEDATVRMQARAEVGVEVSTDPPKGPQPEPLPPNRTVAPSTGHLSLAVPGRAAYKALTEHANQAMSGRSFEVQSGSVSLKVNDVEIYPTGGGRLVVGVGFSAKLPWRVFDAKGHVWVVAKPVVEAGGKRLVLTEIAFARKLDNPLWSTLSALLEGPVRQALAGLASFDLGPGADRAAAELTKAMADPTKTGGVELELANPHVALGRLIVGRSDLIAEAILDVDVFGTLQEIRIAQ
jgi:hypothetical protein